MNLNRHRSVMALVLATAGALVLSACGPGGAGSDSTTTSGSRTVSKDVAGAGEVTLTVWDVNSEGAGNDAQKKLNQEFQDLHPNVKIQRVARSFSDIKTTLGLALDSGDAPDVVQANQGYPDMGTFVKGGLLTPLNDYADLYGWRDHFPAAQLAINSFSADGKVWQGDNLYGISHTGEIVGIYYNKAILHKLGVAVPTTISDFNAALATVAAAGTLPISFGNSDKFPGIHLFGVVEAAVAGKDALRDLVTGKSGTWTGDATVKAATMLQNWSDKKYITPESGGIVSSAALQAFTDGTSAFHVSGTWSVADIKAAMGTNAGFFALCPDGSDSPTTIGGAGMAWSMSSATKHADVAAAYIDFVTNSDTAQLMLDSGNLPSVLPEGYKAEDGTLQGDVVATWQRINAEDNLVPYIDYTTSTFYGTITSGVQELIGDRITPKDFAGLLQTDYRSFLADR